MPKCTILLILIGFWSASCKNKLRCKFSIESLLAQDSDKLLPIRTVGGKTFEFRDKGLDTTTSGYYEFFSNGRLKSYWFFRTMEAYTYNENYDTSGRLINSIGKPLVYRHVKIRNCCTLNCKFYFFALNKQYDSIDIKTNGGNHFRIKPTKDSVYSSMEAIDFQIDSSRNNFKAISHVRYLDKCNNQMKSFVDTLSFNLGDIK
jgi:hypothetical protein